MLFENVENLSTMWCLKLIICKYRQVHIHTFKHIKLQNCCSIKSLFFNCRLQGFTVLYFACFFFSYFVHSHLITPKMFVMLQPKTYKILTVNALKAFVFNDLILANLDKRMLNTKICYRCNITAMWHKFC